LLGVGLGQSRVKWGRLPEAHTDFIFSVIGEELGLLGCVVVVALFAAIVVAGVLAGRRAHDREGMLVAVGISTWLGLQAVINIGVAVGALPNKGITLPFVSYGGSSLIVSLLAAGILLNVARQAGGMPPARPGGRAGRAGGQRSRSSVRRAQPAGRGRPRP
jgi:cell division protein FtsW